MAAIALIQAVGSGPSSGLGSLAPDGGGHNLKELVSGGARPARALAMPQGDSFVVRVEVDDVAGAGVATSIPASDTAWVGRIWVP